MTGGIVYLILIPLVFLGFFAFSTIPAAYHFHKVRAHQAKLDKHVKESALLIAEINGHSINPLASIFYEGRCRNCDLPLYELNRTFGFIASSCGSVTYRSGLKFSDYYFNGEIQAQLYQQALEAIPEVTFWDVLLYLVDPTQ